MHFQLWRWGNMRDRAKAGKCGWETCSNTCGGTTFSIRHYTNASQVRNLKRALQVPLHLYILTVLLLPHLNLPLILLVAQVHWACFASQPQARPPVTLKPWSLNPTKPQTLKERPRLQTPNPPNCNETLGCLLELSLLLLCCGLGFRLQEHGLA